jgi:hypothetical protein
MEGDRISRLQAQGLAETDLGLLQFPQAEENNTETVVRRGMIRDEAQSLPTAGLCFGKAAESG